MSTNPEVDLVRQLTDPRLYQQPLSASPGGAEALRGAPVTADALAFATDKTMYRYYVDHSCDLTMRGGTTSGVAYPLAVCALAQHYVFRSVRRASAWASAASAPA